MALRFCATSHPSLESAHTTQVPRTAFSFRSGLGCHHHCLVLDDVPSFPSCVIVPARVPMLGGPCLGGGSCSVPDPMLVSGAEKRLEPNTLHSATPPRGDIYTRRMRFHIAQPLTCLADVSAGGCGAVLPCSLAQNSRTPSIVPYIFSTPHHSGTWPSLSLEPVPTCTALAHTVSLSCF